MHRGLSRRVKTAVSSVIGVITTRFPHLRLVNLRPGFYALARDLHCREDTSRYSPQESRTVSRSLIDRHPDDGPTNNIGKKLAPERAPGAPTGNAQLGDRNIEARHDFHR